MRTKLDGWMDGSHWKCRFYLDIFLFFLFKPKNEIEKCKTKKSYDAK